MPEIIRPIYVEKDEGVGSLLSRIQGTSDDKLALIFPEQSVIFKNVLEVELLKKQLSVLGKIVRIITPDKSQEDLAKGIGFSTGAEIRETKDTDQFLEDFYHPKDGKVTTPLIKSKMTDIKPKTKVERQKTIKIEELPEKQITQNNNITVKTYSTKTEETPQDVTEDLKAVPRVEPISLTEEDINQSEEMEEKKEMKKKIQFPKFKKPKISLTGATKSPLKKIFVILLLFAIGIFLLTATFLFPKADVSITPARETAQLNIDILFNSEAKAVDFENNTVPSQIFKMTKTVSKEFPATKEENIKKKATGVITIYNGYSSEPQTLVKTTRFKDPDGKVFRITKTITVPGAKIQGGSIVASSIDADVIADEAGESYNIPATKFTIPGFKGTDKYSGFSGKSKAPMTGGLIKKGLVVGEDDITKAEATLKDELLSQAKDELIKQMGEDFILINKSLKAKISEAIPVPAKGEPADKFVLTLKALAQGFAYKEEDLSSLIEDKIALKISDKRLTLPKTRNIKFTDNSTSFDSGKADFSLSVQEDISWKIDKDKLKNILIGKNQTEAKEAVGLFPEIDSARFTLWPFWIHRVPKDIRKINISVDY